MEARKTEQDPQFLQMPFTPTSYLAPVISPADGPSLQTGKSRPKEGRAEPKMPAHPCSNILTIWTNPYLL